MPQEFLASFAVDIDEGGVNRLQRILESNRELAEKLAAAFDAARSSMEDFIQSASKDLTGLPFFPGSPAGDAPIQTNSNNNTQTGTYAIDLSFDRAAKQLETFLANAKKQLRLNADASGIVSAVSSAISQARSMLAGAGLKLTVKTETEPPDLADGAGPVRYLSTGGRFSTPTQAEIAEDGNPEYVIPVTKPNEAVPLVRSLLSELSAPARETLAEALPSPEEKQPPEPARADPEPIRPKVEGRERAAVPEQKRAAVPDTIPWRETPVRRSILPDTAPARPRIRDTFLAADLPELLSAAPAAALPPVTQHMTSNNVSAPVNIRVEAANADPEEIGKSIYDTAEQYLLRTLQGVNA